MYSSRDTLAIVNLRRKIVVDPTTQPQLYPSVSDEQYGHIANNLIAPMYGLSNPKDSLNVFSLYANGEVP
jgi:hypothetical protein